MKQQTTEEFLNSLNRFHSDVKPSVKKNISEGIVEYKKQALDGTVFGIVKEGKQYVIKTEQNGKFNYINGVANKTKNVYETYQTALKVVNLMCSEIAKSGDLLEEKRFVLKQPIPKQTPAPVIDSPEPILPDENSTEEEIPSDDDMPTDDSFDNTEPTDDEDLGVGNKKDIQKTGGKLAYDLRNYDEDDYSDIVKWVAKSIISAIDPSKMDENDSSDIVNSLSSKLEPQQDEQPSNEQNEDLPEIEESVDDEFNFEEEPQMDRNNDYCSNCDDDVYLEDLLFDDDENLIDEEDEYGNSYDEEFSGEEHDEMTAAHEEFMDNDGFDLNLEDLLYEDDEDFEGNDKINIEDKIISYEFYNANNGKVIKRLSYGNGTVKSVVSKYGYYDLWFSSVDLTRPVTLELENARGSYVLKIRGASDDHLTFDSIDDEDLHEISKMFKKNVDKEDDVTFESVMSKSKNDSDIVEKKLDKLLDKHATSDDLMDKLRKFYYANDTCDYPRKDTLKTLLNEQ